MVGKKATIQSLSGDVKELSESIQAVFKRLGKMATSIVGSEDGKVEGLVHQVRDLRREVGELKKADDDHQEQHGEEADKVSEDLAGYNVEIKNRFKLVYIGIGIVGLIAIVSFWLAVGLPGEALKSAFLILYKAFT